jgi:hypothetical protein
LRAAVSIGETTPSEAVELGRLLESYVRTLEVTELEERLGRLERTLSQMREINRRIRRLEDGEERAFRDQRLSRG